MMFRTLSRRAAESLEDGRFSGWLSRRGADAWQRAAAVSRPLSIPANVSLVGVGGAVLGGSGKTPLTQSLARQLHARGVSVAVVASAYPARLRETRVVHPSDDYRRVGDEALMLARALAPHGIRVVVGSSRGAAVDRAAELARVVVVDGLLQTHPTRLSLSLLAVDGARPWGAGKCPPAGDLRASPARLLRACDAVVSVAERTQAVEGSVQRPQYQLRRTLRGACMSSAARVSVRELSRLRVGVCLGVARPGRVLDMLHAHGIEPRAVWLSGDHTVPHPRPGGPPLDLWITTPKCAVKLPSLLTGRPVAVLDVEWQADESLISLVFSRCIPGRSEAFSRVSEAPTPW